MIAAEGMVRLGTTDLTGDPAEWLERLPSGCIVLTYPHTAEDARILVDAARAGHRFVEVLLADNPAGAPQWVLRSFVGPVVHCSISSPPQTWINRWNAPETPEASKAPQKLEQPKRQGKSPADWFIDATEVLGDAALAHVKSGQNDEQQIMDLEKCLEVVVDHEIIHQRLGQTARALQLR